MSISNFKKHIKVVSSAATMLGLLVIAGAAQAGSGQDLTSVLGNVQSNIGTLAPLLSLVSYIAGIAFCIAGIVQFKAHKDNPTQVPLSKPLVYLGVGAALLFLPSIVTTAGATIFGSEGGTLANPTGSPGLPS